MRTSVTTWRGREPGRGRAFPLLRLRGPGRRYDARHVVASAYLHRLSSPASAARAQGRLRATAGCTRSSTTATG